MFKRFQLSKNISAQFVIGALIGAGLTLGAGAAMKGSAVFSDVPNDIYYDTAVGEMYDLGIIKGFEDGKFHPDEPATRGQIAVMMKRLRDELKGIEPDDEGSGASSSRSRRSSANSSSSSSRSSNSSVGAQGAFRFTIDTMNVSEQQTLARVTVLRTGGSKDEVTVKYATEDGTATQGEDYTSTNGTITLDEGETSKLVSITLKDDATSEGNETFKLVLSQPEGGAVLGSPSTLTINLVDNESGTTTSSTAGGASSAGTPQGALGFSATAYGISEDAGNVTITVLRNGGTTGAVSVNYATSNGTAQSGNHYTSASGKLDFAAGESSKTFVVPVIDNSDAEGNKTVNLTLSTVTGGATIASPAQVQLSIIDNEAIAAGTGSFKFSSSTYNTTEADRGITITVQRTTGSKGAVILQYNTTDGTASSGSDYTSTSGTMTFQTGETAKTFFVPIAQDSAVEGEEGINLSLTSSNSNIQILTPTATIKIQ